MSKIVLAEQASAPDTPGSGKVAIFVDTNGDLAWKDDAGNVIKIAAAGSYTLTIPATGTAALRDVAQTFSAAQTFSNALVAPGMKPASDSTTALQLQKSNGTAVATVDTTNDRIGINTASPSHTLDIVGTERIKVSSTGNELLLNPDIDGYGVYIRTVVGSGATNASLYLDPASNNVNIFDGTNAFILSVYNAITQAITLNAAGDSWISNNLGIGTTSPSTRLDIDAGALEFAEMAAPSSGAANTARLFARDNGSGKTQLCVIFNTGAIQVLATEP